jgi:hypothetical protein
MPLTPTPQLVGDGPAIDQPPVQVECVFRQDTGIEHEAMPADPTDTPVGRRLHVSHAEDRTLRAKLCHPSVPPDGRPTPPLPASCSDRLSPKALRCRRA